MKRGFWKENDRLSKETRRIRDEVKCGIKYIYGIFDHVAHTLIYIGCTGDIHQRFKCHKSKILKKEWAHCSIEVLQVVDERGWRDVERECINFFKNCYGIKLRNKFY